MNALCMGISLLAEGDVADLKPDPVRACPLQNAVMHNCCACHRLTLCLRAGTQAFAATQGMPTLAGQCNDLRNCCETILHLLNDVLDMEKMRSGAYVYSYRPVDLTAVRTKWPGAGAGGGRGGCCCRSMLDRHECEPVLLCAVPRCAAAPRVWPAWA